VYLQTSRDIPSGQELVCDTELNLPGIDGLEERSPNGERFVSDGDRVTAKNSCGDGGRVAGKERLEQTGRC
jgi:hypothetical protein